ncbi:MAG TPA: hypothetical protein VF134_09440 [Candidatus Dormibacteraeota bacterium]
MAIMQKNFEYFFSHYIRNVARFRPDFERLRASGVPILPAVGAESEGQLAHDGGLRLG